MSCEAVAAAPQEHSPLGGGNGSAPVVDAAQQAPDVVEQEHATVDALKELKRPRKARLWPFKDL